MASTAGSQGTLIGATLGGYQVESLIGRGAMGTVYLARDLKLNRQVALKVLLGSLARTPSVVKQFHLEAQAAAPLKHPGIVRIYSAGVERGTPFIAMEFVDGEPLDRFLRRTGPLKWQNAFHIGAQVALALDCAHRNDIVHRDVKPSNIMLDKSGRIRLADFGIANIQSEGAGKSGPAVMGTPQYMSPEQCTGQSVGPSSDLFALGVILYQMMCGEMPFTGESSMALVKAICTEHPRRLSDRMPDVPDDVARLVAYLLEKEADDRPANARVVHGLMTRLQEQEGGHSAIPEALTAFIKEELDVRTPSGAQPARSTGRRTATPKPAAGKGRERASRARALMTPALLAASAVLAFSLPFASRALASHRTFEPAPVIEAATFADHAGGGMEATFHLDGYQPSGVAWSPDGLSLLIEVEGMEGGLTQGATGIVLLDPESRQLQSVEAPVGPGFDAACVSNAPSVAHFSPVMASISSKSPLANALPVVVEEGDAALVLPKRIGEGAPRPTVLARVPQSGRDAAEVVRVVAHPSGDRLALVLRDRNGGDVYVAERRLGGDAGPGMGGRMANTSGVLPESVRYSPTGGTLAFLRRNGVNFELWVAHSGGEPRDVRRIVDGVAAPSYAFHGNGDAIAISLREGEGAPRLALVDVRTGGVIASQLHGELAAGAWDAAAGAFVYRQTATDGDSASAVFYRTSFRGGDTGRPIATAPGVRVLTHAVDPRGRWLAAVIAPEDGRNVVRMIPLAVRTAAAQ